MCSIILISITRHPQLTPYFRADIGSRRLEDYSAGFKIRVLDYGGTP